MVGFEIADYDHSLPLVIDPRVLFSTYIGGNTEFIDIAEGKGDSGDGIAVDSSGSVYITGNTDSTDFPATSGAYQQELELRGDDACLIGGPLKCGDAYVLKLNTSGTQILYATYLGGHNPAMKGVRLRLTQPGALTSQATPLQRGKLLHQSLPVADDE